MTNKTNATTIGKPVGRVVKIQTNHLFISNTNLWALKYLATGLNDHRLDITYTNFWENHDEQNGKL